MMMRILKIILALLITVVMLYITRKNSMGRPEEVSYVENGYTFDMVTVPKITEHETDTVRLSITGPVPDSASLMMVWDEKEHYTDPDRHPRTPIKMALEDSSKNIFATEIKAGDKGGRIRYYFELVDARGNNLAEFYYKDQKNQPFLLKYIGVVPVYILVPHIFFMFATVFCITLTALSAFRVTFSDADPHVMAVNVFWATLFSFLGTLPFGIPMNHFAFGSIWEAVPFGTDATDNKSQLMLIYYLMVTLAAWGSFRNRKELNLFSDKTLGWLGLGAFAVMLFMYFIPHSIQFSNALTYIFCYSFIGVVILIYILGLSRRKSKPGR